MNGLRAPTLPTPSLLGGARARSVGLIFDEPADPKPRPNRNRHHPPLRRHARRHQPQNRMGTEPHLPGVASLVIAFAIELGR